MTDDDNEKNQFSSYRRVGAYAMVILTSVGIGFYSPLLWSMYADVADYATEKNGTSSTGMIFLTSSLRTPKLFIKEFGDFLMSCHQHCLGVNLLVQR